MQCCRSRSHASLRKAADGEPGPSCCSCSSLYPVTLSKLALIAPVWLLCLLLLSSFFEARIAVILSLFLPVTVGVILALLFQFEVLSFGQMLSYFSVVNFRTIAFPSLALDAYHDFLFDA